MSNFKAFIPEQVKREHISKVTFIYGTDIPGLKLRMSRFEEILSDDNENPLTFKNASEACSYLMSGDMFRQNYVILVEDISDALGSNTENKKLFKQLVSYIKRLTDEDVFICAANMKQTQQLKKFIEEVSAVGAIVRTVDIPVQKEMKSWIDSYANAHHINLTEDSKQKILSASGNNVDIMEKIILSLGNESSSMSNIEIKDWIENIDKIDIEDLREAIVKKDIVKIKELRNCFAPTDTGYRNFLLKLRYALFDLYVASLPNGYKDLTEIKEKQYGWNANVNKIVNQSQDNQDIDFLSNYLAVEKEIENVSGASKSPSNANFVRLLSKMY